MNLKPGNTPGAVALFFGPQPMDFISKAIKVCGKNAELDPDVARMAGANFAIGLPEHLALLRKRLESGALQAEREARGECEITFPGAMEWLATGERGSSSEALFTRLSGISTTDGGEIEIDHPHDPSDFSRCRFMLEACPGLMPSLQDAAGMSAEWAALVGKWDLICETMDQETPNWRTHGGRSDKTYAIIKQTIGR